MNFSIVHKISTMHTDIYHSAANLDFLKSDVEMQICILYKFCNINTKSRADLSWDFGRHLRVTSQKQEIQDQERSQLIC